MQKTGRIIYYPAKYWPSFEEQEYLKRLQDEITFAKAQIALDCKYDKYQILLRNQSLANRLRDKWQVLTN